MGSMKRTRYFLLLLVILYPLSSHGLTNDLFELHCAVSLPEKDLGLQDYFFAIDPISEDPIDHSDCRISNTSPPKDCIFVKKGPTKAISWVNIISQGTHDHDTGVSALRVSEYSFKPAIPIFLLKSSFLI